MCKLKVEQDQPQDWTTAVLVKNRVHPNNLFYREYISMAIQIAF